MIRFCSTTDQTAIVLLTPACRRRNPTGALLSSSANPASSANHAVPDGSLQAPKTRGSDFIHFESQKIDITPLSSTKSLQNSSRFFAIFVDFCAPIGPFYPSNRPSAAIPGQARRTGGAAVRVRFSMPPLTGSAGAANPASSAARLPQPQSPGCLHARSASRESFRQEAPGCCAPTGTPKGAMDQPRCAPS